MKKLTVLFVWIMLQSFVGVGQISFFKIFTNNGYDYGEGISQLSDSSYLITGSSSSFHDDPSQAFLLKIDSLGEYLWSKNYGGSESDLGRRVLNWNDSIFFITGYSNSSGSGAYNFYMVKTDKNGNEIFQKHFLHDGWDKLNDAIITEDSTIYMVGETTNTETSNKNFYIVKSNVYGDTLWTRNIGTIGDDALYSIKQFDETTFYAVGESYNLDSTFSKASFIKFDSDGNVIWIKEFGANGAYSLSDFYILGSSMYAVGHKINTIDGDIDEYRLKVSLNGTFEWEESISSSGELFYDQVTQYGNNNKTYIASHYKNEFSTPEGYDVGITRFLDNLFWDMAYVAVTFSETDLNRELIPTNDGGLIAVGYITTSGMGGSAVYVLKIGPNDEYPFVGLNDMENLVNIKLIDESISAISIYPNPASGFIKIQSPEEVLISICDINGKILFKDFLSDGSLIETDTWQKGVYFVNIQMDNFQQNTIKLIIQ